MFLNVFGKFLNGLVYNILLDIQNCMFYHHNRTHEINVGRINASNLLFRPRLEGRVTL